MAASRGFSARRIEPIVRRRPESHATAAGSHGRKVVLIT